MPTIAQLKQAITIAEQIEKLQAEVAKAVATPEIRQKLGQLGFEPIGSSTTEFAKYIDDESAKYGQIIRDAKIKAE